MESAGRVPRPSQEPTATAANPPTQHCTTTANSSGATASAPPTPAPKPGAVSPLEPHITQIARTTESPLAVHLQNAFNAALAGRSDLDPAVLQMDGMSGKTYRMLINNLIRRLDNPRYLEIGTWAGSTLCSAINRNSVRATAIDNWSGFGGPKAKFVANLERFKTPNASVTFLEQDFRTVDYTQLGRFNVYMFDGPHGARDQFDGIAIVQPALDDEFVLIVDDWNCARPRDGTMKALYDLNLSILYSYEIRTSLDGSHPTVRNQFSDWHNGLFIAVLTKPKDKLFTFGGNR
jgi:Methyltransferase domain